MNISDLTTTTLATIFIAFVLSVVIIVVVLRFTFNIKRQMWNQRQQINLLVKIAMKLGVPKGDVDIIEMKNNTTDDDKL